MRIQILGPGCAKCKLLTENADAAARNLGLPCELEKITDIMDIVRFGVMTTPALAVDGKVKLAGRVANIPEIQTLLTTEALREGPQ